MSEQLRDSVWTRTLSDPQREELAASDAAPSAVGVAVVGAGLIGLWTARELRRSGVEKVAVVDRGPVAGEASGANAGGLWFAHEALDSDAIAALGRESGEAYLRLADEFDFDHTRRGMIELDPRADQTETRERAEKLRQAGYRAEPVTRQQVCGLEPGLAAPHGGLLLPDDGQLHPLKLAAGLAAGLRRQGVSITSGAEVQSVETSADGVRLILADQVISAEAVVIACGAWTPMLTETLGWRPPIRPIRGVLLALDPLPGGSLRHTIMSNRYYYWQSESGAIVAGGSLEDVGFERGVDEQTVASIRSDLGELLPTLAERPTACSWYGFRPFCEDQTPLIGPAPGHDRVFVNAGHFRRGVLLAPASARLLADQLTGRRSDPAAKNLQPAHAR